MMNLRFKANYHFLLEVAVVKSKVYLIGSCSKNADASADSAIQEAGKPLGNGA